MFERELQFFIENQPELVAKYRNKTLLLRDGKLVGAFESPLDAYLEGESQFPLGTFMVQPCAPGPTAYTVTMGRVSEVEFAE